MQVIRRAYTKFSKRRLSDKPHLWTSGK